VNVKADQSGKVFLCESGDVTDEGARIGRHQDQEDDPDPHADAESEGQVVPSLTPVEEKLT